MEERLQKILSRYAVASRRQAETMIESGRVRVNGNTAKLGDTADEKEDVIEVDGVRLKKPPQKRYIILNKPRGYVTTLRCEKGRKTVADLIADCGDKLYPVGRLDMFSEGLLLMTNDGEFANRMMHPKEHIDKEYFVWVTNFTEAAYPKLSRSIEIDGKKTLPAKVRLLDQKNDVAMLEFVICEGRNRQIRRLCESAGMTVTRLKRVKEGPIVLGKLPVGKWRELTEEEREALQIR